MFNSKELNYYIQWTDTTINQTQLGNCGYTPDCHQGYRLHLKDPFSLIFLVLATTCNKALVTRMHMYTSLKKIQPIQRIDSSTHWESYSLTHHCSCQCMSSQPTTEPTQPSAVHPMQSSHHPSTIMTGDHRSHPHPQGTIAIVDVLFFLCVRMYSCTVNISSVEQKSSTKAYQQVEYYWLPMHLINRYTLNECYSMKTSICPCVYNNYLANWNCIIFENSIICAYI